MQLPGLKVGSDYPISVESLGSLLSPTFDYRISAESPSALLVLMAGFYSHRLTPLFAQTNTFKSWLISILTFRKNPILWQFSDLQFTDMRFLHFGIKSFRFVRRMFPQLNYNNAIIQAYLAVYKIGLMFSGIHGLYF